MPTTIREPPPKIFFCTGRCRRPDAWPRSGGSGSGAFSTAIGTRATKIVFLRLPRGPIPRPDFLSRAKSSSIRELAARPNVILCDEHAFDSLEHPELFGDGMHLNRAGVAKFSPMLASWWRKRWGRRDSAMLFNTTRFFVFLAVVLALFYALPRRFRKYLLLAASYFFYASWNPKFVPLLLTLTAIDFTAGLWLERTEEARRRKAILVDRAWRPTWASWDSSSTTISRPSNIAMALGQAGAFLLARYRAAPGHQLPHVPKHLVRGGCLSRAAAGGTKSHRLRVVHLLLSATGGGADCSRARFLPRASTIGSPPAADDVSRGLFLIALGLTKKMAFADQFAAVANAYFGNPAANPGKLTAWCGVFAFGMQIYFDFSGYTDMAIGMAKLLGFHFPINFRRPYLARSITDFWRRWHISLSTWLRDYLYIPLGGNRHGRWMTYRNLMLTMLLGGMWHGASWNFLIWGGYQGALLSVERAIRGGRKEREGWTLLYPLQAVFTFALVLIGWVFFRAADLRQSVYVIGQMFTGGAGKMLLQPWHIGLVLLALTVAIAEEQWEAVERLMTAPAWAYAAGLAAMLFCLEIFGAIDASIPFIYFQF